MLLRPFSPPSPIIGRGNYRPKPPTDHNYNLRSNPPQTRDNLVSDSSSIRAAAMKIRPQGTNVRRTAPPSSPSPRRSRSSRSISLNNHNNCARRIWPSSDSKGRASPSWVASGSCRRRRLRPKLTRRPCQIRLIVRHGSTRSIFLSSMGRAIRGHG